ncbi:MAG: 16S rRNA (adenine(1518)-N(6)/adenine(1519)-N(6))-dimethyltransferase RsmA [Candidatus Parvarchaeota archaeon]|jgi:16S rRNA (adenine1518-N6/adenine1519-N6)-dimethyltransferase|nr:16S rRNA (adenine(1518)-N(6)/adenine(1519)-N(6))-dimethyltransferase RsmA [Candidatus Parvarchaeota archaeon]MCL5101340.1 16S rRNA (adenine(1518)-N(6)/adenine(1519)-N(6))-dimethyltransferase RsmA [Candidatus Parvarchaeota archaeon]
MRNTQVFLRDKNVMQKIISAAELKPDDVILEIGSGDGRLTRELASCTKKVYAVERDLNLIDASKMELRDLNNIEFINDDALNIEFASDIDKVVSNLPYAISSPITTKIIYFLNEHPGSIAILMYQKEFGERMIAIPGIRDYSMLSVFCQYTSTTEKLLNVSKNCFKPTPSVDSMVVKITPKNIRIDEGFLSFCRAIFQHKKKNLYSAIMDSREKMAVHSKESLREKLNGLDKDLLKEKVFLFEVEQLLSIYRAALKLGICQESA